MTTMASLQNLYFGLVAASILIHISSGNNLTKLNSTTTTTGADVGFGNGTTMSVTTKYFHWMKDMFEILWKSLDVLGIIPHSFTTKGVRFTYLIPSWQESLGLAMQYQEDPNFVYTTLFERLLIGYYEPNDFVKEKSIQSLVGSIFSVNQIRNNTVKIGHILVNTTKYIPIFKHCIIYLVTAVEPK